ncbi:transcription termination factor MTERF5, chloroplastic isoform X4 [Dendrobium catenatum]|uniref:transcription termination factor MTERF5, chloroplastic isoform X4 n=1 Tax=Dendrobium catenatum TaxID=906689 RepID=UPI0010A06BDB|nr:transcription termination factor MTERF5, chloroplastic isoform X4 [Dendrobium catenatum]
MAFLASLRFEINILETKEKNPLFSAIDETDYGRRTQLAKSSHSRVNCRSNVLAITQPGRVSAVSVSRLGMPVLYDLCTCLYKFPIRSSQACLACKTKTYESGADDHSFEAVPLSLLTAEREEAKAVLSLFLRKQGRELTTIEIRNALIPYLESLHEEKGDLLVDVVVSYPNPPGREKANPVALTASSCIDKKERAVARICQKNSDGLLPANVRYLMDLGMELEKIKSIVSRFPAFAFYTLDRKIKPLVEFLLELGVDKSDIPSILHKRPQLCGISLSENLKPMMIFLESYGVDKSRWAKVICRFPALLTYSRQKVKASVDFLSELGVSEKNIGKILTRCPQITSYSVEGKLRPTAEYFMTLGIDPASLIYRCPQTFGLSIDGNLRPVNEFFLERGYSVQEIATMVSRYGALYTFSLTGNMIPKWNYFLTMDYPRSELVKFPHYFGYSLVERIKPRHFRMKECNVRLILNQMLSSSDSDFEKVMEKKMWKLSGTLGSTKV